jgi:hypothetical protein
MYCCYKLLSVPDKSCRSCVFCVKCKLSNNGPKYQYKYTQTHNSTQTQSLACFGLWVAVSLIATWVFPRLLVFQGVCGCACALVCMRYLCFPGFNSCEVCSGWVICCHRCLTCFKGLCCVCSQVSGSVVSNWPLCEFWMCVLWFFGIYILFLDFLGHQMMDKVQKYNSFNTNTPSESYRNGITCCAIHEFTSSLSLCNLCLIISL